MTFFFRSLTFRLINPWSLLYISQLFDKALADAAALKLGETVDATDKSADVDPGLVETEIYCDTYCHINRFWSQYNKYITQQYIYSQHANYLRRPTPRRLHQCRSLGISRAGSRYTDTVFQDVQCKFGECTAKFKSSATFRRHYKTHLPASQRHMLDCTFEGCDRVGREGFSRKDNLTQHLRRVHHQDIPKTWWRRDDSQF